GGEEIEDLIAERQRARDAPGRKTAVCAQAEGEDEEGRRAEADRPPCRRDEPGGEDEDRGEADRVPWGGAEGDEEETDEETYRGERVVAERTRRVAAETTRGDRERAARR